MEIHKMKKTNLLLSTAVTSLIALGASGVATTAVQAQDNEKCYGVAKAGGNDCQTSNSSCAGTSTEDGQKDAWVYLPAGTCEKLTGGSLEAS